MVKYNIYHKHFHRRTPLHSRIVAAPSSTKGAPWPMPKKYSKSKNTERLFITPNGLYVFVKSNSSDILEFNLMRFWRKVFTAKYNKQILITSESNLRELLKQSSKNLTLMNITILEDSFHYPSSNMEESCKYKGYH